MGRKKGVPNKATFARERAIAASGLTPLDYMLKVMRNTKAPAARRDWAASAAAPYVHPRLATLQTNMNITGRLTLEALVMQSLPAPADNDDVAEMIDITPGEKDAAE